MDIVDENEVIYPITPLRSVVMVPMAEPMSIQKTPAHEVLAPTSLAFTPDRPPPIIVPMSNTQRSRTTTPAHAKPVSVRMSTAKKASDFAAVPPQNDPSPPRSFFDEDQPIIPKTTTSTSNLFNEDQPIVVKYSSPQRSPSRYDEDQPIIPKTTTSTSNLFNEDQPIVVKYSSPQRSPSRYDEDQPIIPKTTTSTSNLFNEDQPIAIAALTVEAHAMSINQLSSGSFDKHEYSPIDAHTGTPTDANPNPIIEKVIPIPGIEPGIESTHAIHANTMETGDIDTKVQGPSSPPLPSNSSAPFPSVFDEIQVGGGGKTVFKQELPQQDGVGGIGSISGEHSLMHHSTGIESEHTATSSTPIIDTRPILERIIDKSWKVHYNSYTL